MRSINPPPENSGQTNGVRETGGSSAHGSPATATERNMATRWSPAVASHRSASLGLLVEDANQNDRTFAEISYTVRADRIQVR